MIDFCGGLSVGGDHDHGGCHMTRRRKPMRDDYSLDRLTWLFACLVVIAAIAGMIGQIAH